MNDEQEWHAHYRCHYCHSVRAKPEIIHCDGQVICRDGDCKNKFYAASMPSPAPKSHARYEHG